ncbi:Gnal [Phodopus roborovskii]|uniref:Gnal protein n=1 Tax=Phodopus roborovskii TaxID=109678 RepID=A0AAU9ZY90_PHORO|nr:Gnal [Phodopus roborovskii]
MGLCYSLRPLLFGSSGDTPCAPSDPQVEEAQLSISPAPALVPVPVPAPDPAQASAPTPAGTLLRRGGGRNPAGSVELQSRRQQEQLRAAEEREAAKEARKVSRGIDRMLREQKRDLQQTHRLLLLGKCVPRAPELSVRERPCFGNCHVWTLQTECF